MTVEVTQIGKKLSVEFARSGTILLIMCTYLKIYHATWLNYGRMAQLRLVWLYKHSSCREKSLNIGNMENSFNRNTVTLKPAWNVLTCKCRTRTSRTSFRSR
jgi:hypothetical protein